MRLRFYHSLRFKIMVGLAAPLILVLGLISYLQYVGHRDLLLKNVANSVSGSGQLIERSLQHAMMSQDLSETQQILDQIAKHEGLKDLFILDPQGVVRIAPGGKRVGIQLDRRDPTCQVCHQREPKNRPQSIIFITPQGERVFRSLIPIINRQECHQCHDPRQQINGVLITDFSMADIDRHLAADIRNSFLGSAAGLLAILLTVYVMTHRVVLRRLEAFLKPIYHFARGDFSLRVPEEATDEIGELARAFNRMAEGLREKARLEEELRRLYQELQHKELLRGQLLEKVISAQEEERKRVARELHDQFAQTLTAMTMSLDLVQEAIPPEREAVKERLLRTRAVLGAMLEDIRRLIVDLRPTVLDDLGLVSAIRWYAERHLEEQGIAVKLHVSGDRQRLPGEAETALFRIAQEAISNVARHAEARQVNITLTFDPQWVRGVVEDDGRGFDVMAHLASADRSRCLGLLGMQERASLVGGKLTVESRPGQGTRVAVEIPLP